MVDRCRLVMRRAFKCIYHFIGHIHRKIIRMPVQFGFSPSRFYDFISDLGIQLNFVSNEASEEAKQSSNFAYEFQCCKMESDNLKAIYDDILTPNDVMPTARHLNISLARR